MAWASAKIGQTPRVVVGEVMMQPQRHVVAGGMEAAVAFGGTGIDGRPRPAEALPVSRVGPRRGAEHRGAAQEQG